MHACQVEVGAHLHALHVHLWEEVEERQVAAVAHPKAVAVEGAERTFDSKFLMIGSVTK